MGQKTQQMEKPATSPTLNTVLMVEKTLEKMDKSVFSIAEVKRVLPKQVNHNTLLVILDYLQKSNKIFVGVRGISWIENPNQDLKKAIARRGAGGYEAGARNSLAGSAGGLCGA